MKQRIESEQLGQLTDAQIIVLREWWAPQTGDFTLVGSPFKTSCEYLIGMFDSSYIKLSRLPILSIGQMIEYLQDTGNDWTLHGSDWDSENICDLLWKRVVHYL